MDEKDFDTDLPEECLPASVNNFSKILVRINMDWKNILLFGNQSVRLDGIINNLRSKYKDPYNEIRPPVEDIFNAFRFTHVSQVKVVILGQDPYYAERHAHGLSFSSRQSNIPKSLNTIFNCMVKQGFLTSKPTGPNPADLTSWAAQGVLLLNTALTAEYGKAEAHVDLWASYTDQLISDISGAYHGAGMKIVWVLWGKVAQAKRSKIIGQHYILEFSHPASYCDWSECPTFKQHQQLTEQPGNERLKINWASILTPTNNIIEAFTDGSTNPNKACPEARSGYSIMIVKAHPDIKERNCWGNPESKAPYWTTNIRAEGQALLTLLERVHTYPKEQRQLLSVIMDCEFWIEMIYEYMPNWERTKLDFNTKKNPDITVPLWKKYKELLAEGTMINISHVPSHGKQLWGKEPENSWRFYCYRYNSFVDQMAKEARTHLTPGQIRWG